ncbi:MAG: low temperature requirement protein A [Anaerolineaceae bacterium]|nr:MAG: low temperature requirement protein A [Anaerolineaceae bacterium]
MQSLRHTIRIWWQPPRNISDREQERSVTFLELFYDLVYVILIAQLGHALSEHVNLAGVLGFAFLFIIVWVAWVNGTMYHELHGNNDIRTRVFTFLQMLTVASMAVFALGALGESSAGFALSFAAYQLILTYLWWRTGVYDPDHRPLSRTYTINMLISTLLFVGSVFVPIPLRIYLWGIALLLSVVLPMVINQMQGRRRPEVQAQLDLAYTSSPSAVERFGLLTIIVLGEVMVSVVRGVSEHNQLSWLVGITAVLGMLVAIGLWWVYFDAISQHQPINTQSKTLGWMYLHLPLTAGIVATGAAVFNVIEEAGEPLAPEIRWLLVGAIAVALISSAVLMRSIQIPEEHFQLYRRSGIVTFISGGIVLLLGLSSLNTIPLLLIVIMLMLAPVVYGIAVWVNLRGAEKIVIT